LQEDGSQERPDCQGMGRQAFCTGAGFWTTASGSGGRIFYFQVLGKFWADKWKVSGRWWADKGLWRFKEWQKSTEMQIS